MCSHREPAGKGIARSHGDDVGSLDAAAVADRPGHHHVFEILRPIAAVAFLFVTGWQYYLPNRSFFG